jgi:hypothetical protein
MFILLPEAPSPRLEYVASHLFGEMLGVGVRVTHDRAEWEASDLFRILYTRDTHPDAFRIVPNGLLLETGIRPEKPGMKTWGDLPVLFSTTEGDLPFDILSAVFYLITRYEEYLPHRTDAFGRYDHCDSLAWQGGFLDRPLVDIWAAMIREALQRRFPSAVFPDRSFRFQPTYDIDIAWAHRHRSLQRSLSGALASLLKGRPADAVGRAATLLGIRPDPYDAYAWLDRLNERHASDPLYFFLVAGSMGRFDRNISPDRPEMRRLISHHARRYRVGLHPSWASGDDAGLLSREAALLSELTDDRPVRHSRQHYLRFKLPETYRALIRIGITDDHSMGYGAVNGFRASTCTPFRWYDLGEERTTGIVVHPFCFMDATAHHELGMVPEKSLSSMLGYMEEVVAVGGVMETIFHNSMLGTHPMYRGWREAYATFVEVAGRG